MRKIILPETKVVGGDGPKEILSLVATQSPGRSIGVAEMRRRVKVLDALDNMDSNVLVLEDQDHKMLVDALESFPWSQASRPLLALIDAVNEAETVTALKVVPKEERKEEEAEAKGEASAS
jgi:hypothetical protein